MIPEIPPQMLAAAADAPLALLMLWMVHLLRRDLMSRPEPPAAPPAPSARDDLAEFKLEVARTYVPLSLIRDLDSRLSLHLVRIEEKLDEVSRAATAAAAISGQVVTQRKVGFSARAEGESR
ncbi:hypothetical protein [Falsiroseomonas ponticola]|jgi:hypothetical protein|uniref:hypothetical protein n=1 Tax=Falsiroseomonas ponticola TaxID=2786951 RepID=UPI001932019D|nr:hypothetical protein [Roseomonas ponticola]